ncbi:MAG TPA: hypothetical protein VJZ00_25855 [Thermoanaerobaculia bacterium]|nr:hypothetical protein [Thermoanaerobaculia bacterium]
MTLSLSDVRFRANPCVELKSLGELAPEQRERFLELENDPEFYGLLIAKPPLAMNLKSVAKETAELIRALHAPAVVDPSIVGDDLFDLVLDGILEIEHGDDFVCGADALSLVNASLAIPEPRDVIARLSHDALLHAQDLETNDPQALTSALYLFNRIPISPFWRARFPTRDAILTHLGADRGALRALLEREWTASQTMQGWLSWRAKSATVRQSSDVTYKLYVSPRPERIRDAFEIVVRVLSGFPGTPFKIGDSVAGLLRPDKFVAYFTTRAELDEAADALRRELAGCDAHGVPFSASVDDAGLVSWGVDPPDDERALRWLAGNSWRYWIVQRLASALAIAKGARGAGAIEPWQFAIARAQRHGVDVETWTPSAALWSTS